MHIRILSGLTALLTLSLLCSGLTPLRAEEQGPTFQLLQPAVEEVVSATFPITIAFQSKDNTPIVRFDVYLDTDLLLGARLTNPITAGSVQSTCDFAVLKARPETGMHTLYVRMVDSKGRITQTQQTIFVAGKGAQKEQNPPTLRFVSPKDGEIVSKATTIKLEANDDTGVKWVMVYMNGKLRAMMYEPPYYFSWDPVKDRQPSGIYRFDARALDVFNNEGAGAQVSLRYMGTSGRTPIEQVLPTQSIAEIPGVFAPSAVLPSGGFSLPRIAFSNVVPSFMEWTANPSAPLLPTMLASPARQYPTAPASCDLFAVLPPKSLPGTAAMAPLSLIARDLPLTPSLAAYTAPQPLLDTAWTPLLAAPLWIPDARQERQQFLAGAPLPLPVDQPEKLLPGAADTDIMVIAALPAVTAPWPDNPQTAARILPATGVQDTAASDGLLTQQPDAVRVNVVTQPALTALAPALDKGTPPAVADAVTTPSLHAAGAVAPTVGPTTGRTASKVAAETVSVPRASLPPAGNTGVNLPEKHAPGTAMPDAPVVTINKATPTPASPSPLPRTLNPTPVEPSPAATAKLAPRPVDTKPADARPAVAPAMAPMKSQPAAKPVDTTPVLIAALPTPPIATKVTVARALAPVPDNPTRLNPGITPLRPLPVADGIPTPSPNVHIVLDNQPIAGAPAPYITEGFAMMPFRQVVEAKHGVVIWLPQTREVNAWANNTFMGIRIGEREARINADTYLLPVAATLTDNRTMVPLRYLMAAMKLRVEYNSASGTYYLVSKNTP